MGPRNGLGKPQAPVLVLLLAASQPQQDIAGSCSRVVRPRRGREASGWLGRGWPRPVTLGGAVQSPVIRAGMDDPRVSSPCTRP